jgi:hypothetical protein
VPSIYLAREAEIAVFNVWFSIPWTRVAATRTSFFTINLGCAEAQKPAAVRASRRTSFVVRVVTSREGPKLGAAMLVTAGPDSFLTTCGVADFAIQVLLTVYLHKCQSSREGCRSALKLNCTLPARGA